MKIIAVIEEISGELGTSRHGAGDLFLRLRHTGGVVFTPGEGWRLLVHGRELASALNEHLQTDYTLVVSLGLRVKLLIRLVQFVLDKSRSAKLARLIARDERTWLKAWFEAESV